jgi:hypothetical protein
MKWGRFRCVKGQLEVVDDSVHHGEIGQESDDLHLAAALRTEHRVDFINLAANLGPAPAGNPLAFFLDDQELMLTLL